MRRYFLLVFFVFLINLLSSLSFASFDPGIYSGVIHPKSGAPDIPIDFSFNYSSKYVDSDQDEMVSMKRKIEGSFIVDGEGGPYPLQSVNYEFETDTVEIRYYRQDYTMMAPTLTLQFTGTLKNNVISGDVFSGLNRDSDNTFGTFEVKKTEHLPARLTSKYEGQFVGTFIYDRPRSVEPFKIGFNKSDDSSTNPANFELGYTPGHLGSFTLGTWEQAVHTIYIDYLRNKVYMTYAGSTGSITFIGTISPDGNTIEGDARSSFNSRVGTFKAVRVSEAQASALGENP